MKAHVSWGFNVWIYLILSVSILFWTGCFLFPSSGFHNSLTVNGYVRLSVDSSAVEGAKITVYEIGTTIIRDTEYSDSLGYFHLYWSPLTEEDEGDYRQWVLTVHDVDGLENGEFADMDTILIEEDPIHNSQTEWNLTLYVDIQ